MNGATQNDRRERILKKAAEKTAAESSRALNLLRNRDDRLPGYDYFLNLAEGGLTPAAASARTGREVINLLCLQAPLELIHAAGLMPIKIFGGSHAAGNLAAQGFPALMCPMLRSVLGAFQMDSYAGNLAWVLPTTCDWMVKFPEMMKLAGVESSAPLHWLELPHLKDAPSGQELWLGEVYRLKKFLEELTGRRVDRRKIMASIDLYHEAWRALNALTALRRQGRVPAPWFFLMTNTFFMDQVENWTHGVKEILPDLETKQTKGHRVFLAGSPIFFPNFKLLNLLEDAGLTVAADDMCSSERLLPGGVNYSDASEFGLMTALAQRYHQGCLCPTFADNDRRVNNILGQSKNVDGVVFQVLKGCHPFDLESFTIEQTLKEHGLKYLRLETDYTSEDSQNLLTRLEAFRQTLEAS